MQSKFWQRQTSDRPLYPDLLWSRPEQLTQAGKLLIIGGNSQAFAAVAESYNEATKAGIGSIQVLLPDSLKKTIGQVLSGCTFAPSTHSGSFAKSALAEALSLSEWSDAVLMSGDLGRNSETAIMLESFSTKYQGPLIITQDAADYFISSPSTLANRPETVLVISLSQLQKLGLKLGFRKAFKFSLDLLQLVETLHEFSQKYSLYIITEHLDTFFVAIKGEVTTTKLESSPPIWRVKVATIACVWWLQNIDKPLESLTISLIA